MAKNDAILNALNALNGRFDGIESRLNALETPTQQTTMAKPTGKGITQLSERTTTGIVAYIAREGFSAQLSDDGKRDKNSPYLNGFKNTALFAPFKIGDRVTVTLGTFQSGEHDPYERVTAVEAASSKPVTRRARVQTDPTPPATRTAQRRAVETAVKTVANRLNEQDDIARLGIRPSTPTNANPDGCKICGGTRHDKGAVGKIARDCAERQYARTLPAGEVYNPLQNIAHAQGFVDWRRVTPVTVATVYDGSKSVTLRALGGNGTPTATTTAPRRRGRPPGSKNKTASTPATVTTSTPATTTRGKPVSEQRMGKLFKVNNAGTKMQFQEPGQRFAWLPMHGSAALVKLATKLVGKSVTITITGHGDTATVTDVERAPKAAR